jgi:hypothetical protein
MAISLRFCWIGSCGEYTENGLEWPLEKNFTEFAKIATCRANAFMDERIFMPLALAFWSQPQSLGISLWGRPPGTPPFFAQPGGVPLFLQRSMS